MLKGCDLPKCLANLSLKMGLFFSPPCNSAILQSHPQVFMGCKCRDSSGTMPLLSPLTKPSLQMSVKLPSVWGHWSISCSTDGQVRLLPQVTAGGTAWTRFCFCLELLPLAHACLVCTTYTNLAVSNQDKHLLPTYFYPSQMLSFFCW